MCLEWKTNQDHSGNQFLGNDRMYANAATYLVKELFPSKPIWKEEQNFPLESNVMLNIECYLWMRDLTLDPEVCAASTVHILFLRNIMTSKITYKCHKNALMMLVS